MNQIGLPDRRTVATTALFPMHTWPIYEPLIERARIVVIDHVGVARILKHPPGRAHVVILPLTDAAGYMEEP
jgi:hypothetical protein